MSFFSKLFARFRRKKNPETPAPVLAPPVTPMPPPVTVAPPVAVAPTPTPGPAVVPPFPMPGVQPTMMRPVIGITFAPGSTTPIPLLGPTPVPVTPQTVRFGPEFPYPKIVRLGGVNMMLQEPLNESFRPSAEAFIYGGAVDANGLPLSVVGDPSNAPDGYPRRSSFGYPLFYPNVNWDTLQNKWVGVPSGPARIVFEGSTHDDEAAITRYLSDSNTRDENLRRWQVEFSKTRYSGGVEARQLTKLDAAWLYGKSREYHYLYQRDLHRTVLTGYNADIARVINLGEQELIQQHGIATPDGPLAELLKATVAAVFNEAASGTIREATFTVDP